MVAEQRGCAAFDGLDDTPMQRNMNEPTAAAIAGRRTRKRMASARTDPRHAT